MGTTLNTAPRWKRLLTVLRRSEYPRSVLSWTIVYAWFVTTGRLIWWLGFAFLDYDGPSSYLQVCVFIGFVTLLVIGMLPVSIFMHAKEKPKDGKWVIGDYTEVVLCSVALVPVCFVAGLFIFGIIGWVIGWFSEDAANVFLRYTTIMRD